jgi:hypothetical protein
MLVYHRRAMRAVHTFLAALAITSSLVLSACGGGGGGGGAGAAGSAATAVTTTSPSADPQSSSTGDTATAAPPVATSTPNVVPVILDGGTTGRAFNSPFVDVTVCMPGTNTCQQIDHVLLDTGSFGLRVLASALAPSVQLPAVTAPSGSRLAECAPFASGFSWGSVRRADVRIGGESASAISIQVVNDSGLPAPPASCSGLGNNFGAGGHANGILGIGTITQDCGPGCAASASPGIYYSCDTGACAPSIAPLGSQVSNPVASFATDNNGVMIRLPAIPLSGVAATSGTLTFGIGTQTNNQLGSAAVYTTDAHGSLGTTYKGVHYSSFFDTGSNGLFFPDPSLTPCANSSGFYCPASPQALVATVVSNTGVAKTVSFTVEGLQSVSSAATVAPIAGSTAGMGSVFDWGLPFFFGRTVFVAISGAPTPGGPGPYLAF